MPKKKNQHFVPKVHLREFSSDSECRQINIWLCKKNLTVFGASISDQCSKPYFYGKDLVIEDSLILSESVYGKIVKKLRDDKVLLEEDILILLFFW